jgi:hypothetical protein
VRGGQNTALAMNLTAIPADFDPDAAVALFTNPGQITGDFWLGTKRFDGMEFFEQGLVSEETVQSLMTGIAQINDLTPTFGFGDEVMLRHLTHFAFAQGAYVISIHRIMQGFASA